MDFITIKRTYGNPPISDTAPLGIDSKHEGLRVIGGLPNWSYVEPADVEAAQALLSWLLAWIAKHGATPAESDLLKACSLYPETPEDFDTEDGKAAYCDCVVEWINETLRPAMDKAKP